MNHLAAKDLYMRTGLVQAKQSKAHYIQDLAIVAFLMQTVGSAEERRKMKVWVGIGVVLGLSLGIEIFVFGWLVGCLVMEGWW